MLFGGLASGPPPFVRPIIGPLMKANSSYAFSRRVAQSSGIDLCLKANFTGPSDTNLIVAKGSLLQIFRLHEPLEVRHLPKTYRSSI